MTRPIDVAVIGAGAAGLMAAIAAAEAGAGKLDVALFDSRKKIGAKILISGGTRCNVTNVAVAPSDYHGGPSHFIKHVLEAFTPQDTRDFFARIGVELALEPSGKYFPITHSGRTVLEALMREFERQGARLVSGVKIQSLQKEKTGYVLKGRTDEGGSFEAQAKAVVLATGGLSYPETGSDGTGYVLAGSLGHSVHQTYPSLTPLTTSDADWPSLSGITLEAKLSFFKNGKKHAETAGSFLFTHNGYSGPAALDISRHVAAAEPAEKPAVEASFLTAHSEETLKAVLEDFQERHPDRLVKSFLSDQMGLPERFVGLFLGKFGFDARVSVSRLKRDEKGRLIHALLHCPLAVSGVLGYKKAEVTAGGVPLGEVRVATMESRISPGLYFAGEILDADGRIGGFNFQWAWSTGQIAGKSAAGSVL